MAMNPLLCLFLIAATLGLGGCERYGDKQRTWTEDVALDDGTQVKIKRHVRFTDHNSWSGDAYGATDTEGTLEITATGTALPKWSAPLIPLVLYGDGGEWVLVTKTSDCAVWRKRGGPRPPYWEFRLRDGQWVETPLSESSIGRRTNLFFRFREQVPRRVTVADKLTIQSEATSHELYRSINPDPRIFNCQ